MDKEKISKTPKNLTTVEVSNPKNGDILSSHPGMKGFKNISKKLNKKPAFTFVDGSSKWKIDDAMIYEACEREKKRRGL